MKELFLTLLIGIVAGVLNLLLAVPVIILAAKDDKKSVLPMAVTSIVLGTVIGIAGHFVL